MGDSGVFMIPGAGGRDVGQRVVGIVHLEDGEDTRLLVLHNRPALESLELPRTTGSGTRLSDERASQWTPVFYDVYGPTKIYRHEITREIVAISYAWRGTRLRMVTTQDSALRAPWAGLQADHGRQTEPAAENDPGG